ncbi:MAG: phospholipid carrier-dependent glycosyltransferase [Candidatus Acidiferrales bacterium]
MSDHSLSRQRANFVAYASAGLIVMVCLFSHLGAIGLVGPDEPRYAWIARAMATSGDWVTPRLYGQPWFEKPVLYYWAAALGFSAHLPAEWAARLPSSFAALVAAIAIGWLGWKFYATESSPFALPFLIAPLIFSTSVAAIGFARAAGPDMLFSSALTVAMATGVIVLSRRGGLRSENDNQASTGPSDHFALAVFGGSLGLAVLAKGPAGVVLAAGAIGIWALATSRWRDALRLTHPLAIAVFCLVVLPWYVLCALRNPDFLHIFIFQHNFERYLTPMFQHRQPFWYFVPILLLGLLPWTACLWPAFEEGLQLWRQNSWSRSPGFFFACWAIFPFLFFSFSQSKLPGYILPAIPALSLLIAVGLQRRASGLKPQATIVESARYILVAIGATWIVMALSAVHWINRLPAAARDISGKMILHISIIAVAGGIVIVVFALLRNRGALLLSFFMAALCVELAGARVLPTLDPFISARFHGDLLRNHRYPNRVFAFHLTRSWQYGLNFYLGREVAEWSPSDADAALVLTTAQGLDEIRKMGRVQGALDEPYEGILYVPVLPAAR